MLLLCFQKSTSNGDMSFTDVGKFPLEVLQQKDELPDGVDKDRKEVGSFALHGAAMDVIYIIFVNMISPVTKTSVTAVLIEQLDIILSSVMLYSRVVLLRVMLLSFPPSYHVLELSSFISYSSAVLHVMFFSCPPS